jgi:hypothetical protein
VDNPSTPVGHWFTCGFPTCKAVRKILAHSAHHIDVKAKTATDFSIRRRRFRRRSPSEYGEMGEFSPPTTTGCSLAAAAAYIVTIRNIRPLLLMLFTHISLVVTSFHFDYRLVTDKKNRGAFPILILTFFIICITKYWEAQIVFSELIANS